MIEIPTNIDSELFTRLSGEKVAEYLALKAQVADSSLDSLQLAWLCRDTIVTLHITTLIAILLGCIVWLMFLVFVVDN